VVRRMSGLCGRKGALNPWFYGDAQRRTVLAMFEDTISRLACAHKAGHGHMDTPHHQAATPHPTLLNIKGGGVFFFWMAGAMRAIAQRHSLQELKLQGASSGALIAVLAACDVDFEAAAEAAHRLCVDHDVYARPLGLMGVWGGLIRSWLQELLPEDAAQRCSERVTIALTAVFPAKTMHVREFGSKDDVIDACMASVHIPFFLDGCMTANYKGMVFCVGAKCCMWDVILNIFISVQGSAWWMAPSAEPSWRVWRCLAGSAVGSWAVPGKSNWTIVTTCATWPPAAALIS
jgi:Patatin-like phospholipase